MLASLGQQLTGDGLKREKPFILRRSLDRNLVLITEAAGAELEVSRPPVDNQGSPLNIGLPLAPRSTFGVTDVTSKLAPLPAYIALGQGIPL